VNLTPVPSPVVLSKARPLPGSGRARPSAPSGVGQRLPRRRGQRGLYRLTCNLNRATVDRMRATTLLLPADLQRRLRETALRESTSVAELLRRGARLVAKRSRAPRSRGARGLAGKGLPRSVDEYLSAPAGSFAARGARGKASEPEDPYAGPD
jgi:hypothetical protein